MRLSLAFALAVAVTSCKTANRAGDTAEVKDIESVKKVVLVQGNQPGGGQIAVIRCAAGWIDASGQTEFAVPWNQVKNDSYAELEQKFCTQQLGGGGGNPPPPPPPGGGAPVKLGYYGLQNGTGCSSLHLTPKTQGGVLKGITAKCVDDDKVANYTCGASGSCTANGVELAYFDEGVVEVTTGGNTLNYKFVNETDSCLSKGGKRHGGHCWFFAAAANTNCTNVCTAAQMTFDENGAGFGGQLGFCHQLADKFGMQKYSHQGSGEGAHGCVYCDPSGGCNSSYVGVWSTSPTNPGIQKAHLRQFCPCK